MRTLAKLAYSAIMCGIVGIYLICHRTVLEKPRTDDIKKNRASVFVEMLAKHSSPDDKLIILAMTDYAFADMAVNMYETSFKRHGIKNFLFVGAGRESCEFLITKYSLPCYYYANDSSAKDASAYNSLAFIRKMNIRTYMIIEALQAGYTVLHTDTDVVFLKNPLPELKEILKTNDIAAMWDDSAYNAGFVAIKPTQFSINVYTKVKKITDASARTPDQNALNDVINGLPKTTNPGSSVKALDKKKYLCGIEYYEHGKRYFPSDCAECIVVHNNWIVGREAKIYRFKEHLTWMFDEDTYYTNSTRKYICYSNPMAWSSQQETEKEELDALQTALAIGKLLDRIVILPRFHCKGRECPLNSLVSMKAFDRKFAGKYRENSFLQHPWIPPNLKNPLNVSHSIISHRNFNLYKNFTKTVDGTILKTAMIKNGEEDEVRKYFGGDTDPILQFAHLYWTPVQFSNIEVQSEFQKAIDEAFKRAGYRQF